MEVDEALEKLGTIGRWQILYYTVISTACCVVACFHMLAIVYIGKCIHDSVHVCNRISAVVHVSKRRCTFLV